MSTATEDPQPPVIRPIDSSTPASEDDPPLVLRRDLLARGCDDNAIARMVRVGTLVRIRQGAFAAAAWWHEADDRAKHLLRARAVLAKAGAEAVLSHVSAVAAHGGPLWGVPLDDVHITRTDRRSGRRQAGVVQHRGLLTTDEVVTLRGLATTTAARTALDVITRASAEVGLVVANDFLFRRLCTREELLGGAASIARWSGSLDSHVVLRWATPLCESVGESRLLHLVHQHGLPAPVLQLTIYSKDGRFIARVDLAWPDHGVFVEFDGREKYLKPWRPGENAAQVVVREKQREDAVRQVTGWRCIRLTWADLERPMATARLLGAALGVVPVTPLLEARAQRF